MKQYKYFRRYIFKARKNEEQRKLKILQTAKLKQYRVKLMVHDILYPRNSDHPATIESIKRWQVRIEASYQIFNDIKFSTIKEIHLFRKQK